MPALYRTHRPQTWEALVGQETIARTLQNEIRTGRIAHAYLFAGPRGVGKTTTARLLAKTINCTGRAADSAEPDNACAACVAITERSAIDLIELDAATNTGIDNVRENIIENAIVRPMQLTYKVFIIDEVHRLSAPSFDALLKTLEEPPAHVVFILATTEIHKLPETILSRCQRFNFNHIAPDVMRVRLLELCKKENALVEGSVLDTVIARSGGCMRDAESLLDQLLSLGTDIGQNEARLVLPPSAHTDAYPFVTMVLKGQTRVALKFLQELVGQGVSLEALNKATIDILRALLVSHYAPDIAFPYIEGFKQHKEELHGAIASTSAVIQNGDSPRVGAEGSNKLQTALSAFLESLPALKYSFIPQLPLELALVKIDRSGTPQTETIHPEDPKPQTVIQDSPVPALARPGPAFTQPAREPEQLSPSDATDVLAHLIAEVQKTNPSLGIILASAHTLGSVTNQFVITVEFPLYHDQLMQNGNRRLIETQLCAITNVPWKLECRVVAEETTQESEASPLASEIAAAFGGEIV